MTVIFFFILLWVFPSFLQCACIFIFLIIKVINAIRKNHSDNRQVHKDKVIVNLSPPYRNNCEHFSVNILDFFSFVDFYV